MPETLQQLADRGIQIANGQQYENVANNVYTPVGGGGSSSNSSYSYKDSPERLTLGQAQKQADAAFSGIVNPMNLEDIRAREQKAKELTGQTAGSIYDPAIQREKQVGGSQVSTAEGVVGQRQGFNISTAELAFVGDVQNKVQDRIKEVENTKASYIASGNLAAADRADKQIQQLNEFNTQMAIAKANYALQLMAGNRDEAQLSLAQSSQALQQKQSEAQLAMQERQLSSTEKMQQEELKLNAYKTALDTPVGKKFTVNGTEFIGLKDASGIDPSLISLSTDDKGYETGINKLNGQILWKSTVPTGKTKTAASSVTVNMKNSAIGGTENQMWDPVTKQPIGTYSKNDQTGVFTFFNQQGEKIPAPQNYTTIAPKQGTGTIELSNGSGKTIKIE